MDGDWNLDGSGRLHFFKNKHEGAILAQKKTMRSNRIKYSFKFQTKKTKTENVSKKRRFTRSEMFTFIFGPRAYDLKIFNKSSTVIDPTGLILVLSRQHELSKGQLAITDFKPGLNKFNIQKMYQFEPKRHERCQVDYLARSVELVVDFNFELGDGRVLVNGESCLRFLIKKSIFPENKLAFAFYGFSVYTNPVSLFFEDVKIEKLESTKPRQREQQKPKKIDSTVLDLKALFSKEASMPNALIINRKIQNQLTQITDSTESLARRSQKIEMLIEQETESFESRQMQADGELPSHVDTREMTAELERVLDFNQRLNARFAEIKESLRDLAGLEAVFGQMSQIQRMVV